MSKKGGGVHVKTKANSADAANDVLVTRFGVKRRVAFHRRPQVHGGTIVLSWPACALSGLTPLSRNSIGFLVSRWCIITT